jgi:hypothetical protein
MKTIHNHMKLLALVLAVGTILFVQQNATSNQTSSNQTAQGKSENAKDQFIFNSHSHSDVTGLKGNDGNVLNTDDSHSNSNDNTNRPYEGECCADRVRENTHDKPNTGGNSDNGDETEP